jgi:cytochrome c biogenesis protein CcmG/thiol:disulfide interchange protein DsbE
MIRRGHVIASATIVVVAVIFIGILSYGLTLDPKKVPPAILGQVAHPFRVSWIQGRELVPRAADGSLTLADLRGKPVVLNFWASWCVSCREEARELEAFWKAQKDKVYVVGIAIQDEKESAKKFAEYFGKTYALALDEDGKAAIDYGVSGVPETFIIDANGIIKHKEVGPVDVAKLTKLMPLVL